MDSEKERRTRWRLVLGEHSEPHMGGLDGAALQRDIALGYLYNREYGRGNGQERNTRTQEGTLDASRLDVPAWINMVHELFPRRTIERIERDALERYQLEEMVTNPDLLQRAQPSQTLLKAVLRTKHLMNQEVLAMARKLVSTVVQQLMEKLAREIRTPFTGAVDRRRRSFLRVAKNFDARTTIRRNLANYDPQRQQIVIGQPYFFSRVRRQVDRWQLIILVDESGSMAGSVIHAAVTASIFFGIRALRTHLVLFDTSIVDVTEHCTDPVETLMKVQLGGGTDIGMAVRYAGQLVENPRRTIVVLISDFCEGAPVQNLYGAVKNLIGSGVTLLGLAALDSEATPTYNHDIAAHLVKLGAHVAAMTPGELADWVAQKVA